MATDSIVSVLSGERLISLLYVEVDDLIRLDDVRPEPQGALNMFLASFGGMGSLNDLWVSKSEQEFDKLL